MMDILEIPATNIEGIDSVIGQFGWQIVEEIGLKMIQIPASDNPLFLYPHSRMMAAMEEGQVRGLMLVQPRLYRKLR